MKIILRGDCCPRRGIAYNRDLFGERAPQIVKNEKSRTDFLVDHLTVGSPSPDDVAGIMDLDRMGKSLRAYSVDQVDRSTLDVTDADLIVMDNYADMNFQAWRDRQTGWKLWIHPGFVRDREAFDERFEPVERLSLEESVEHHARLIEDYRERNGDIPVLYLHQPVALYSKLHERREFDRIGELLEQRVPRLFSGLSADDELEPADMDSCGPGQTLHFTGPTYRRMILRAMDKGLSECLPQIPANSPS